ncbi:hypothetical protein EDD22DRAFT_848882 [Suillus occidentalis]|nr:hypothetical protein EDD22DRAFT_848882 [Suillus occidentalis]
MKYVAILSFTSELPIEIKAKSNYSSDTQKVKIMSPSPIHKTIITWLHKCFITYSLQIGHNDQYIKTQFFINNQLPNEELSQQVPDIMDVMHCVDQLDNNKSFVQWLIKNNSDIKKLIKILIDEDSTFQGPKEHTKVTNLNRKKFKKFKSLVPPKTSDMMYGPIVVGGHNWLKLNVVRIIVYLKDKVLDHLLNMSTVNLKTEIISIMEEFGLEKSMIDKARCNNQASPKLCYPYPRVDLPIPVELHFSGSSSIIIPHLLNCSMFYPLPLNSIGIYYMLPLGSTVLLHMVSCG